MSTVLAGTTGSVLREEGPVVAVPWYVVTGLLSATSIVVGLYWDIAWHRTIGRDTFWTPAHIAIYLGGLLGGAGSGYRVLRSTFAGDAHGRAASVRVWGFRGPLGAWVSIWGAVAMLTSAPFDDWWHNAYGLDVKILSPPHVVLAVGMIALVVGARLQVLARQNANDAATSYRWMHAYLAGVMLAMAGIVLAEKTMRPYLHASSMYRASAVLFPFMLVTATASRLRYPATTAAAIYSLLQLLQLWVLPLVPGEPLLGPVLHPVSRMVPLDFPLLLVVPAFVIDLVIRRRATLARNDLWLALELGAAFLLALLVVQWPFADFLMSDASRNVIFRTDNFGYTVDSASRAWRHEFVPEATRARAGGLLLALAIATVSSWVGLLWWRWMIRVRR